MSRQTISLKSRVRYERLAQIFDRRTDLEAIPDRIWYTVGHILRRNFRKAVRGRRGLNPAPTGR